MYHYYVYQDAPKGACDYPRLEEFGTKAEAIRYMKACDAEDKAKGRQPRHWNIDRVRDTYQYYVTYDYSHSTWYEPRGERVFASNAKEACKVIMDRYYDDLSGCPYRNAAAHGVRYPYHLHAERIG